MMGLVVRITACFVRHGSSNDGPRYFGWSRCYYPASGQGMCRLQVSIKTALTKYLQKHLDHTSHGSGLSSESELDSSKQDKDADDNRSAELEEWHGFQDTTSDAADRDGESEPALSSDSRPVPVPSSSGTPRPSL
jgi:hypothetical protein